jgi:nucleoid-associated protein YgaU
MRATPRRVEAEPLIEAARRLLALALPVALIATGAFILGLAVVTGVATFREGGNREDGLRAAANAVTAPQGGARSKASRQAAASKAKRTRAERRIASRYVVRRGDTLWEIAVRRYGNGRRATIARIKKRNGIRGAALKPGQVLILPGK